MELTHSVTFSGMPLYNFYTDVRITVNGVKIPTKTAATWAVSQALQNPLKNIS